MPLVWGIAAFVVLVIGVYALMPRGGAQQGGAKMKPEFEAPTNDTSRMKPKVYGTRWVTDPNIADYGRYTTKPIWSDEVYDD